MNALSRVALAGWRVGVAQPFSNAIKSIGRNCFATTRAKQDACLDHDIARAIVEAAPPSRRVAWQEEEMISAISSRMPISRSAVASRDYSGNAPLSSQSASCASRIDWRVASAICVSASAACFALSAASSASMM